MSSAVSVFGAIERPSFATKGVLSATALALAGGASSSKRVSIRGGVFRLVHAGKEITSIEDRFLDVVIVAAAPTVSRTMYDGAYDETVSAPPVCWSADGNTPDATVKNKPASNCAQCPNNVKGSGTGDSRACRYSQRLAVVLANDVDGDVLQLTLPATSIFGKAEGDNRPLQEYARFMSAQGNDVSMLVTRMRFDTGAAVPKLFFKPMRWLTEDEYASTSAKATSPEALQAVTFTVFQQDAGTPAAAPVAKAKPVPVVADEDDEPAAPPPKAKAKAKPVPVVADEDDEPAAPPPKAKAKAVVVEDEDEVAAPEPKVRKAVAAVAAPAASGLAAVLSDWDDE
jgi:hypothetical protein